MILKIFIIIVIIYLKFFVLNQYYKNDKHLIQAILLGEIVNPWRRS